MQASIRSYLTAGVGLVGASAIALSPVAPPLPDVQVPALPDTHTRAVQLTADFDPIAAWIDAFNTASGNATQISNTYFEAPGAALQQAIVNQVGYLGDFLQDPESIGDIFGQIGVNLQAAFQTSVLVGASDDIISATTPSTLDGLHQLVFTLLPGFLPEDQVELVTQIVNFLASPLSGVLIGAVGPLVSPAVAFVNSIQSAIDALNASDPAAALQALIDIPANVTGAFFNGADLNLDALVPLINGAGVLPEGTTIDALDLNFGGLFSPGVTQDGIGGSIFNSLGLTITTDALGFPITLPVPSQRVGPLAALTVMSQLIAKAIGWDGEGNPLTDLIFPSLPSVPDEASDPDEAEQVNVLAAGDVVEPRTTAIETATTVTLDVATEAGTEESGSAAELTTGSDEADAAAAAEADATVDAEEEGATAGSTADEGSATGTDATDLSDGNKVTPGDTADDTAEADAGSAGVDAVAAGSDTADSDAGDAGADGSGNESGDSE